MQTLKLIGHFTSMLLSGLGMFVIAAPLSEPFKKLVEAFNTQKGLSAGIWAFALGFGLLYGGAWLFFYLMFKVSEKHLVDAFVNRKPNAR